MLITRTHLQIKTILIFLMIVILGPVSRAQYNLSLNSDAGHEWRVKREAETGSDIMKVQQDAQQQQGWVKAKVPGTVYAAYVEQGLEKDPNFGDNIWNADRAKFDQRFWYITSFRVPSSFSREKTWLIFNGVNRNAEVYLNGRKLGEVNNFMHKQKFDVSALITKNGENQLAVLIDIPKKPMANYASPTYVSSAGWDWMPYIPGLNSGITDKVFLTNTGDLTIEAPWIQTKLPTNARADLEVSFDVRNATGNQQQAIVKGLINPGNIAFSQKVTVEPDIVTSVKLDKEQIAALAIHNPKLWWPNGYGDPNLYTCKLSLQTDAGVADETTVTFGIKRYSYDTRDSVLHIYINDKPLFIKGGNWGMSEYMLRCQGKEYDTKVRLHKEMNFNMIRNWIGSTTDEEFYEACDRYGIMVWDDFWLNSNPNLPRDASEFNSAVIEKIKRLRNHPSVAVWCGDNEGWPEAPLNNWIRENIRVYDGDARYYQANSHADNLSGSGPWANKDPKYYFTKYPTGLGGNDGWGFRTELGTAVFTNVESFKKFIPKEHWWPRNSMWDKHYFGPWAFNADADFYVKTIETKYGKPHSIEEFCRKAQLVNIETNKAMYEGWQDHIWDDASGIMTWMSNASLPSLIWQTYDYYYDLTGAFWGIKKACEPLHIQWNPVTNEIRGINTTGRDADDLTAEAEVYNLNGVKVGKYSLSGRGDIPSNSAATFFRLPFRQENLDLARGKDVYSSSSSHGQPRLVADGKADTRWASEPSDNQWIYVDLEKQETIRGVKLNWEQAYARTFNVQVSDNAKDWTDVTKALAGKPGEQDVMFSDEQKARYVRIACLTRATSWGFSLWSMEVLGGNVTDKELTSVHFLKLKLKDQKGNLISDNFYWRASSGNDFTALNSLPKVNLKVSQTEKRSDNRCYLRATISNPSSSRAIAFAVRVQAVKAGTGEQILPAIVSDGYFSLLKGESKDITVEFDAALLGNDRPLLKVEPFNNTK